MGFDDRLWLHLVENHDAHLVTGPAASRRRTVAGRRLGVGVAACALAAAVVTVVLIRSGGTSTWSAQVMQRAAAVLTPKPSSREILHVAVTQTMSPLAEKDSDTHIASLSEEGWLQQGSPYRRRVILHPAGGAIYEETDGNRIYNMTSNEISAATPLPAGRPRYAVLPGTTAGTRRLRAALPHGGTTTITISPATLRGLRSGDDEVGWVMSWNGHVQKLGVGVFPSAKQLRRDQSQQPNPSSLSFATQLRGLLSSGHARVTRTNTDDGRAAIEIASVHPQSGPRTTYYVNPTTYAPIELDTYGNKSPRDVTRVHFRAYEILPLAGHSNLLRFTAPASARVSRNPADYWHAASIPEPF